MDLIQPLQADRLFLNDVRLRRSRKGEFRLWWLGQSGFLIQWNGRHLLLDPYLSDSLTRKYAETDKPHVRMTSRVVAPERLRCVDVLTSSHNHTDHLDAETILPIRKANPALRIVVPAANVAFAAERLGLEHSDLVAIDDGQSVTLDPFTISAVPAAHEELEHDDQGRLRFLGYVVQFGPWTVYHSGDTLLYEGMAERLRSFRPDVALLPINGRAPERRVAGNLDGAEAADLARSIGARLVVPCHFEMFAFNTASPDLFVSRCIHIGQPFRVLKAGECLSGDEIP